MLVVAGSGPGLSGAPHMIYWGLNKYFRTFSQDELQEGWGTIVCMIDGVEAG